MTIGERIKYIRGNMSQADFATMTKLNKATLSRYERNTNVPDANAIVRICAACNIRSEWLLTGEGEPSKNPKAKTQNKDNDENKTITIGKLEYNKCILDAISQAFDEIVKYHHNYFDREKFQILVYILYEEFVSTAMDYIQTIRGSFEKQIIRKNKVIKALLNKLDEFEEKKERHYQCLYSNHPELLIDENDINNDTPVDFTYDQSERIVQEEFLQDRLEELDKSSTDKKIPQQK